jgi:hypothetical protein
MAETKPWFLVMTAADANRPGSDWQRQGAASNGKIAARPITPEGWAALAIFVAIWTGGPMLIWLWGYLGDNFSIVSAVLWTIVFEIVVIGGFVLLVWSKSTRLPPA